MSGGRSGSHPLSLITEELRTALDTFARYPLTIAAETLLGGVIAPDSPIAQVSVDPDGADEWMETLVEWIGQHGAVDMTITIQITVPPPPDAGSETTR